MHASLKLSPEKFPAALRQRVKAAHHGSLPDTEFLLGQLPVLSDRLAGLLLPVWYAALARPENAPNYNIETGGNLLNLQRAVAGYHGVFSAAQAGMIESGAVPDIWGRLVPWVFEFEALAYHIPDLSIDDEELANLWLAMLRVGNRTMAELKSVPGTITILARVWKYLIERRHLQPLRKVAADLAICTTISNAPPSVIVVPNAEFDELFAAIGGNYNVFADLVNLHLHLTLPSEASMRNEDDLAIAKIALDFVIQRFSPNAALREALLASQHGFIEAFTKVVSLARPPFDRKGRVQVVLSILMEAFADPQEEQLRGRSHLYFARSVKAGLVETLDKLLNGPRTPQLDRELRSLIEGLLPRLTIYHSVLSELGPRRAVLSLPDSHPLSPVVNGFRVELEQALRHYDAYSTRSRLRACAEGTCPKILQPSLLKSCGGCGITLYCSVACQKRHWRAVHRRTCVDLHEIHSASVSRFGARNLSFMRFLIKAAFKENKDALSDEFVRFLDGTQPRTNDAVRRVVVPIILFEFEGATPVHILSIQADTIPWLPIPSAYVELAQQYPGRIFLHLFVQRILVLHRDSSVEKTKEEVKMTKKYLHRHIFPFYVSGRCAELYQLLRQSRGGVLQSLLDATMDEMMLGSY
ncbi:hypothetical protein HMN09_01406600 [Mycena chlorophos]|uniref:MYND-type domain-containing protein n=1 Tax=Mycena chlorophos TaxID=658473 RepID=A0A8H6RWR2_MYCCL|nr:hypothetical protein HMN09_01406600 [Mycena chlorophos]